jgi:3-methyladenine DNA glycosylase/8-oxoguanine DNA glycosylase
MARPAFDAEQAIKHLTAADPKLGALIARAGRFAMELKPARSVFAALSEAIVYQQLSTKAAATIFGRLCGHFPRGHVGLTAERLLAVSDARIRAAGISRPKLKSLRDLARRTVAGEIPTLATTRSMADDAIIERLVAVHGIGRWTAEMFLMFRLGRPDVLPINDYSLRKAYAKAFKRRTLPSSEALEKVGEKWRPYRTVASWYLWRALEITP